MDCCIVFGIKVQQIKYCAVKLIRSAVLLNSKGERFMFNYIPERFASETAESIEEASEWLEGKEGARRPPELLTRDVVAKAILAEVKAGRGSPHGGALLDIATRLLTNRRMVDGNVP